MTPTSFKPVKPNTNLTGDCTEQNLSDAWAEYDDFPSSDDLSAFLADLEKDALSREERQRLPTLHSVERNVPLPSVTSDAMPTESATLKDVLCEISRTSKAEDFTAFTDFPSSEDLDAFLADMELDYEHIPIVKSLTPRTTVRSVVFMGGKPHYQAEGSRYVLGKEPVTEDTVDVGSTKPSRESHKDCIRTEEAVCLMELCRDTAQEEA